MRGPFPGSDAKRQSPFQLDTLFYARAVGRVAKQTATLNRSTPVRRAKILPPDKHCFDLKVTRKHNHVCTLSDLDAADIRRNSR